MTQDKLLKDLEQKLTSEYKDTQSVIRQKIADFTKDFDKNNKLMQNKVKSGEISEKQYRKWYKNEINTAKWCKRMTGELTDDMANATSKASEIINGYTDDAFSLGCLEGNKEIADYTNFDLIDKRQVNTILDDNRRALPKVDPSIPKEKRWSEKRIKSALLQSAVKGESVTKLAKRLEVVVNMGKTSAIRNARTMMTASHNMGRLEVGYEAKERGIDIQKKWLATYDNRTRHSHALLNGEVVEVEEEFSNGLMYPADPDGDPSEVYNCRCTFRYVHEEPHGGNTEAEFKENVEVVAEKKEAFKEANKRLKETPPEPKKPQFVPAQTKEEAEQYISQYVDKNQFGALGVDYTGIDLEVANEVNRTLGDLYGTFDNGKFGGIKAPAGNTKEGKLISGATAGYSPIRNSYYLNRSSLKNMKTAQKLFDDETNAIKNLLEHPERYDLSKASSLTRMLVEKSKVSGRSTIPKTIEQVLQHEFGHSLEKKVKRHELWGDVEKNIDKYAPKLSGYACTNTSEYLAESFCSYMQEEGKTDPTLVKIFESFKRK